MRITEQLLLGDSTKRLAEIDSASVDLILTDPPYNTGMTATSGKRLRNFFDDRYSPDEFHHETVKPISLVRRPIEHASLPGDLVCDPFMGSGTTCVVAKMLGRGYVGIELDPRFFSLAAARVASVDRADYPVLANDECH